jgi:hypothetical protein
VAEASAALGHLVRDHRENRCRAAMHDRGAEAAHQPSCDVGFGDREQIPNVLDHREPGAHGKARNRGVDFEAEPIAREEIDNWRRLQTFLDDRRDVAREGAKPDRKAVHHAKIR